MGKQSYYIAMGQGIIGQGAIPKKKGDGTLKQKGRNFYVTTSSLPSCTFICGANNKTNRGGAFHYPNGLLLAMQRGSLSEDDKAVLSGLEAWVDSLDATQMTFVGNNDPKGKETMSIINWLEERHSLRPYNYERSQAGAMSMRGWLSKGGSEWFIAGNPVRIRYPTDPKPFDMRAAVAGHYEWHEPAVDIFGKNIAGDARFLSEPDRNPDVRRYDVEYSTDDDSDTDSDDDSSSGEGTNDFSKVNISKETDDQAKEGTT